MIPNLFQLPAVFQPLTFIKLPGLLPVLQHLLPAEGYRQGQNCFAGSTQENRNDGQQASLAQHRKAGCALQLEQVSLSLWVDVIPGCAVQDRLVILGHKHLVLGRSLLLLCLWRCCKRKGIGLCRRLLLSKEATATLPGVQDVQGCILPKSSII